MDIETIVVAALPGLLFGGINIYTLLKFSYSLGKYQGEEGAARTVVASNIKEIKDQVSEIRSEVKASSNQAAAQQVEMRLEMQSTTMLIRHLQERDKELGERTHKIANLEMVMAATTEVIRGMQNTLVVHTTQIQAHAKAFEEKTRL